MGGLGEWLRGLIGAGDLGGRVAGYPTSSNRASSFHLRWELAGELTSVAATLEVDEVPPVPRLYFWALQASFTTSGRRGGAGHLGLQWHQPHPGSTAVNWGGYDERGTVLAGTDSPLASRSGNPHTRDFPWRAGRAYRLAIEAAPSEAQPGDGRTAWRGSVTDTASGERTVVRDLLAVGDRLSAPMVWSEVFARCDDPPVTVRWSALEATLPTGDVVSPSTVVTNYQSHQAGGCANTDSAVEGGAVVQRTNVERRHAQGARLPLGLA